MTPRLWLMTPILFSERAWHEVEDPHIPLTSLLPQDLHPQTHSAPCVSMYLCVCVCAHTPHLGIPAQSRVAFPGGTEEMKVQTMAAGAAESSSSWLRALHPSAGQACNERINCIFPPSQPQYGCLMLVQLITFSLANPLLTLETGSVDTLRPGTGSVWNQNLGPKSWPDETAWYQRTDPLSHSR